MEASPPLASSDGQALATTVREQIATLLFDVTSEEKLRAWPKPAKGITQYRAERGDRAMIRWRGVDGSDLPADATP
jgi:hypothetical protein